MKVYCHRCEKEVEVKIEKTEKGPHYAKIVCNECGNFIKWLPKPENMKIKRIYSRNKNLIKRICEEKGYKEPFCFFCGRKKEELPPGTFLTIDHILPLKDGGKDSLENMQILCSMCHSLKNLLSVYVKEHYGKSAQEKK